MQRIYLFVILFCLPYTGRLMEHNSVSIAVIYPEQESSDITVTDTKKELNRRIWTFSTSDIFYRKGWTPLDVTQESFVNMVKALHPYAVAYPEGKTSDWFRVKIGDTLVTGGTGNGYNIPSWVPSDVLQGVGTKEFFINGKSYDFFNAYAVMIKKIPAHGYILGNIMTGTCKEVLWMIRRTNPEYVQLGLEQMRAEAYEVYWKKNPALYKAKFNSWADSIRAVYPKIKIVADVPPSRSSNETDAMWNKELSIGLKADGVRDYWHMHHTSRGRFTGDIGTDSLIMNEIFTKTLPSFIEKQKNLYPDKELVVDQWSVSLTGDGGKNPYKRTFFGASYIPKMVHFMIMYNLKHNNTITSAKYENLKQLIGQGQGGIEYEVAKIMANLFSEPATVLNIDSKIPGIQFTGVKTKDKYKIIAYNESGKLIQMPKQINCDGRMLHLAFKETLSSTDITSQSISAYESQSELRPYSIVYFEMIGIR